MRISQIFDDRLHRAIKWCLRYPLGRSQWLALGLWLGVLAGGMIALGGRIVRMTHTDIGSYDQGGYVTLAKENRPLPWPTVTDGVRNPLFPWLLSRTADGSPDEVLATGKRLNVWCGALLAMALGVWAGRRLAWLPAMTFASIGALGVILPLSTYCTAELVFYGLFFAAWKCATGLLDRLTFPRSALAGAMLALAYLAKPAVTLFCASFGAVALVRWLATRHEATADGWPGVRPLLGAAVALAAATPLVLPRALDSWRQFGDPFQNTAANCFWEEDWAACVPQLAFLNPRGIHKIPPQDRPTMARYFVRNGWSGAWNRLTSGMALQGDHVFLPGTQYLWFDRHPSPKHPVRRIFPFRGYFLLPPLVLTLVLGFAVQRRFGPGAIARGAWFQAAFILLLTSVSFGAYSWYAPLASGARFILALYLPVFGALLCAAEALRRRLAIRWLDAVCAGTWLAMLGIFLVHMGIVAIHPYFDKLKDTV